MTVSFDYDESSASKADNAGRIDSGGPYVGQFKSVNAMSAKNTGTEGVHFEFEAADGGFASFDLYTKKTDGSVVSMGTNFLMALQAVMGIRGLKSVTGKYEGFVDGKREEVEGEIFPQLCGKDVGIILQKEWYTKGDGNDGFRMNLYGVFHATSRLTASELKEKKTTPEKLDKLLKSLKTKDNRVAKEAEPSQPIVGTEGGGY